MARKGENIYKRRDGRWEGRFICGRKPDGSARYSSVYGKSYTETREKLISKRATSKMSLPRCILTVEELLTLWLNMKRSIVKPSSYARYAVLVERHIVPQLGKVRVSALTAQKLSDFIRWEQKHGRLDGRGGLSTKTVNDLIIVLKSALRSVQHTYMLPEEALGGLQTPKIRQKRIQTFGEQETIRFSVAAFTGPDLGLV